MAGNTAWATIQLCVNGNPGEPVTGYIQVDCTGAPTGLNRYIRPDGTLYVGSKNLLTECCCVDTVGGSGGGVKLASGGFGTVGSPWPDFAPSGEARVPQAWSQADFESLWPTADIVEAPRIYKNDGSGLLHGEPDFLADEAALALFPGGGRDPHIGQQIWVEDVNRVFMWDGLSWRIISGEMPHLYYNLLTPQTIVAPGSADLSWGSGTLIEDTDSIKTGSNTIFTCPVGLAGKWKIKVGILAQPVSGTGGGIFFSQTINGFATNAGWIPGSTQPASLEHVKTISFGEGDTFVFAGTVLGSEDYDVNIIFEAYLVEHRPDSAGWAFGPTFFP